MGMTKAFGGSLSGLGEPNEVAQRVMGYGCFTDGWSDAVRGEERNSIYVGDETYEAGFEEGHKTLLAFKASALFQYDLREEN